MDKAYRVPRRFGNAPTAQERRRAARYSDWVKNEDWFRTVRRYQGNEGRAAWSLVGYKPKYRSYFKRTKPIREESPERNKPKAERGEPSQATVDADHRTAFGAETSTSESESSEIPLKRRGRIKQFDLLHRARQRRRRCRAIGIYRSRT